MLVLLLSIISCYDSRKEIVQMKENIEIRMMNAKQAGLYVGMCRAKLRVWAEEIGAARKFGKSVRYDKVVIDSYLDRIQKETRE